MAAISIRIVCCISMVIFEASACFTVSFMKAGGILGVSRDSEGLEAGLHPVKLNVVLLPGKNDVEAFMRLAQERPLDVRFIELMPMRQDDARSVPGDRLLADYSAPGYAGRVGFINAAIHRFCASCNRVRVLSTGEGMGQSMDKIGG